MNFQEKYKNKIEWLLEGDPSIRYQTLKCLVNANVKAIKKERVRILKEGWGKRFMDF